MANITDPEKALANMLNKTILGIEVNDDEVIFILKNGTIEITGQDFDMVAYLDENDGLDS